MNVANLLGLASEALPTPGAPPPAGTATAARPFPALLADALGEGGEPGTLPAAGLLAGAPLADPAPTDAATALETASLPEPEKPLADAADPDADDRQTLSGLAALPVPVFTTTPLPPPLVHAPTGQTPAGLSAGPVSSLSQAAAGAGLGGESLPGGPPLGPAIKAAALALASADPALAAAAAASGSKQPTGPATLRPLADASTFPTAPVDARAAVSAAAASAAVGAAATGLPAHAVPVGTPLIMPASRRADAVAAAAGADEKPSAATSAQSGVDPAAAVRPSPGWHAEAVAAPAPAGPEAGGELPAVAGSAEAAAGGEPAPEGSRPEPSPLRHATAEPRSPGALEGGHSGAASRLEATEAMAPAPEAKALSIQDVPERALRIASELRADGGKQYRAELQLDPPGLGRVRIEIELSVQETGDAERSLTRITVESAAAHEQLQAELPRLRALLAEQGLGEAQVELQLRQDPGHGQGTEEQQAQGSLRQGGEADEGERSGRRLEWRSTHDGLIDLRA